MKKIGMITYRDIADGKGRFLQAFSLYSAIQHLGYDVELIDYYPKNKSIIKESKQNKIMRILKNPNDWPGYLAKLQHDTMLYIYRDQFNTKRTMYDSFINDNIVVTQKKYYGYESLLNGNLNYDAYVCGSDQIWNPNFQGLDPAYYLRFAPESKRIAYAPSLGTTEINEMQKKIMKENLDGMNYVSVREKSGAEIIAGITGKDVKNVLDPTLLLPLEWWEDFAGEEKPEKPYVLTFLFDNNKHPRRIAKEIANKYGYDIISIPDSFADLFFRGNKEISVGPEKFVNLFKNASFVCTQSFHGVILSLIYNRQFLVFNRDTKGPRTSIFSRISDLLEMVRLESRIIRDGEALPTNIEIIDFTKANLVLEEKRQESLAYLRNALFEAVGGKEDENSSN
jgi:hypothetical protein